MRKRYIPSNQIGLFEYLTHQEKEQQLKELEDLDQEENIEEDSDCWFGYKSGVDYSILIHNQTFKEKTIHSYQEYTVTGWIKLGVQKVDIEINYTKEPSLDGRYQLELTDQNKITLPNQKYYVLCEFFRTLEDLIKFIKSDLKDTTLIYNQNECYMESNEWRYDD